MEIKANLKLGLSLEKKIRAAHVLRLDQKTTTTKQISKPLPLLDENMAGRSPNMPTGRSPQPTFFSLLPFSFKKSQLSLHIKICDHI
jgi:hypothetical protein